MVQSSSLPAMAVERHSDSCWFSGGGVVEGGTGSSGLGVVVVGAGSAPGTSQTTWPPIPGPFDSHQHDASAAGDVVVVGAAAEPGTSSSVPPEGWAAAGAAVAARRATVTAALSTTPRRGRLVVISAPSAAPPAWCLRPLPLGGQLAGERPQRPTARICPATALCRLAGWSVGERRCRGRHRPKRRRP